MNEKGAWGVRLRMSADLTALELKVPQMAMRPKFAAWKLLHTLAFLSIGMVDKGQIIEC